MATDPPQNTNDSAVSGRPIRERLYGLVKPAHDVLLYSSVYLAVIAAAEVLVVTELLGLPLSPAPVVAGLLAFAVYGNDRVADVETDEQTAPERTAFVKRYRRPLYTLSAVAYGLAVALAVLGGPVAFALALLPGVAWLCYAQRWLPCAGRIERLKQVFLINSALVAGSWALIVVWLPLAFVGAPPTSTAGVVCLLFFLATFVDVEIPNVRDRVGDREQGVRTLPVVFDVRGTRHALYAVTTLGIGVLLAASVGGLFTRPETAWFLVSLVYLTGVVAGIGRTENDTLLTVAAECSRLPMLALVVPSLS